MSQSVRLLNPILIVGCIIITVSFAVRASFGVFQIPIAEQFGWMRSEFSMAIAIQNLAWGIGQPLFGALAEKIGDRKAIIIGALLQISSEDNVIMWIAIVTAGITAVNIAGGFAVTRRMLDMFRK